MNRQIAYAYGLGWAARCLDLPPEIALGPLKETEDEVVLPGLTWQRAVRRGYEDAVCECEHVETTHDPEYGCRGSVVIEGDVDGVKVFTTLECPCTGFVSASKLARERAIRAREERRKAAREAREAHEAEQG